MPETYANPDLTSQDLSQPPLPIPHPLSRQMGKIVILLCASYFINAAYHHFSLQREYDLWYRPQKQHVDRLNSLTYQRSRLEEVLSDSSHIENFAALNIEYPNEPKISLQTLNNYKPELNRCGFYASMGSFRNEIKDRMRKLDDEIKPLLASTKSDDIRERIGYRRERIGYRLRSAIIPFYGVISRCLSPKRS